MGHHGHGLYGSPRTPALRVTTDTGSTVFLVFPGVSRCLSVPRGFARLHTGHTHLMSRCHGRYGSSRASRAAHRDLSPGNEQRSAASFLHQLRHVPEAEGGKQRHQQDSGDTARHEAQEEKTTETD
ncbi:hypothetical protein WMY93_031650 [Mugilogobius chulae]|uniref:Uncharacterized protein n=1 Tax=Mugilogobius chulae TaxID=88201 RepID=A0AAW0MMB2_9GOBI